MRPLHATAAALLAALTWGQALGGGAGPRVASPVGIVQPGQVWALEGLTADGERLRTTLRLDVAAPTGTPATFRADRGSLLLDAARSTLVALDLQDARRGGLGLACAVVGPLTGSTLRGVLAAGTLDELPARLEAALAVAGVARTAADRAAAAQELGLGLCTLTLRH